MADLRSDTVTRPTAAMRAAMAEAPVGDDNSGEDPSVNELEAEVAALLGKPAAMFVPSGTQGNLISLMVSAGPGEEVLTEPNAHIVTYERGGAAAVGGIQTRTVPSVRGQVSPADVAEHLRVGEWWSVPTRAVAVEQTHNLGGGSVYPLAVLRELRQVTADAGVRLHCDGARLWNAAAASGVSLADYAACFDTLSVCLSKGLGAPVGSLVVGSAADIAAARLVRKRLGGGMRQAGILAAAGLVAVRGHIDRLADDHARAKRLAAALGVAEPETNIVLLPVPDAGSFVAAAADAGVLVIAMGPRLVRLVTHLDVGDAAVDAAAVTLAGLLATSRS